MKLNWPRRIILIVYLFIVLFIYGKRAMGWYGIIYLKETVFELIIATIVGGILFVLIGTREKKAEEEKKE